MNTEEQSTRERIISATIDFIEKNGIHAVTTRKISGEASVNVAAVNYYFGSKDKLLDEVLKLTLNNLYSDIRGIISREGQTPAGLLKSCLYYFLAGSMKYTGITNAHLYGLFVANRQDSPFVALFKGLVAEMAARLAELDPTKSREDIDIIVTQLFSAVMTPCVFPGMIKEAVGLDFKERGVQQKYISRLISQYYKVEEDFGDWHPTPL